MKKYPFNVQTIACAMTSLIQSRGFTIRALLVWLAILNFASTNAKLVYAGKPVPPPPVKYQLTIFPKAVSMWTEDMNNLGELVGAYSDPDAIHPNRLSAFLISEGQMYDLSGIAQPPLGWFFAKALGINDKGSIVGYLGLEVGAGTDTVRQGFVLHRPIGQLPFVEELPDNIWSFASGKDINEDGTVLGQFKNVDGSYGAYVYDTQLPLQALPVILPIQQRDLGSIAINNSIAGRPAQVCGTGVNGLAFRYTLGNTTAQIINFKVGYGINDWGDVCGGSQNKNLSWYCTRYSDLFGYRTIRGFNGSASRINSNGDMASGASSGGSYQLYSEGRGVLSIGNWLVGSTADVNRFKNSRSWVKHVTERGSLNPSMPGFPALGGYAVDNISNGAISYPFILIPVAP